MAKKKTHEEFVKELEIINPNIEITSNFIGSTLQIGCRCKLDNYEWQTQPYILLKGHGCPKCSGKLKKTSVDFEKEVYSLVKTDYSVLGEYKSSKKKILMRHNCEECNNYEWEIAPNNFLNGQRCPKCQHRSCKKTTEEFKKEVYDMVKDEYVILGEYISSDTKILIRHKKCNHEFFMRPEHFLRGVRCPKCNESKGERKISEILDKENIYYSTQYRIKECRDKKTLPFDFAVFEDGEKTKLKCLIEYDGELHYKPFRKLGKSYEKLLITQIHDKMKDKYCKDNNIKLIRIPYWEFNNIEKIISKEFGKEVR
jgi:Zn ribbon nucleic-acid-binding protein